MTVKELKEELKHMPNDAKVYMLTDKSYSNYDEDGRPIKVYPLTYVTREHIMDFTGWDTSIEENVLLEVDDK